MGSYPDSQACDLCRNYRGPIVLKLARETLLLLACTGAMTFALAHAVHRRQPQIVETAAISQQPEWTGRIAEVSTAGALSCRKAK